jgi:hypothetical protein
MDNYAKLAVQYMLVRTRHSFEDVTDVTELAVLTEHAVAKAALLADAGDVDVTWTRPEWTAVSETEDRAWHIMPFRKTADGQRVRADDQYGPTRRELQSTMTVEEKWNSVLINCDTFEDAVDFLVDCIRSGSVTAKDDPIQMIAIGIYVFAGADGSMRDWVTGSDVEVPNWIAERITAALATA